MHETRYVVVGSNTSISPSSESICPEYACPLKRTCRLPSCFCQDLPSLPNRSLGKILVTGASGYIGGRLVPELSARGYQVRAMVRRDGPVYAEKWPDVEVVEADALDPAGLAQALDGIYCAYYLIHSLLLGTNEFETTDLQAAAAFRDAAGEQKVGRIIYLGGLGDIHAGRSRHLQNRLKVAEELSRGSVPVTFLRAAIIIGSGSASYEIIRHLVGKLHVLPIPRWAQNRCQPIAIRDVIKYLVGVLETPETNGLSLDIGGKDILTYKEMLTIFSETLHRKMLFPSLIFPGIPLSAYIISLLTPVPAQIAEALMEGLQDEVVCRNDVIQQLIPFKTQPYRVAIVRALSREEQDRVYTRWSDAYPRAHELAIRLHELENAPTYTASYAMTSPKKDADIFKAVCKIGGKAGWFNSNWMWRLRGGIDRLFFGVGSQRGRKRMVDLSVGDVIDFWRVEDIVRNRKLLLRAEMKLPGKAWLEFTIEDDAESNQKRFAVRAYFHTQSIAGKIYWYAFLPFHNFIFKDLIAQIEQRS